MKGTFMFEKFDKEYLKSVAMGVVGFILSVLLLLYLGYQTWKKVTSDVECEAATPYTVSRKSSGTGYIFRTSTVLDGEDGSVVPSVGEGERVAIYAEVARVYSNADGDVVSRLKEVNDRISLLSSMTDSGELSKKDVTKLDSEVYDLMTDISRSVSGGQYGEAVSRRLNLLTKINKRNLAAGVVTGQGTQLDALISEKASLTGRLGVAKNTLYAEKAGWYYSETDGYESLFDASEIHLLTYDKFLNIISQSPKAASNAGKIVTENRWYFVCEMPSADLKKKTIGDEYTLFFPYNKNQKIVMTLYNTSFGTEGMGIAVFTSEDLPADFDFATMQTYELLEEEYTGFKVPKSAVRIVDDTMGVYVLSGEIVHFRKIDVITDYENSYIVAMTHEEPKDEEPVETNEIGEPVNTEPAVTSPPETEPEAEDGYRWLGLGESIIVKGKGLKDGRVITTVN